MTESGGRNKVNSHLKQESHMTIGNFHGKHVKENAGLISMVGKSKGKPNS